MPINILMPALSPTMEKGNLAKWLKKEGDTVKSGDIIAEIETDKATMEVEAVDEGTIAKILVAEGTADVPVNDVIAVLAADGEDVKAAAAGAKASPQQTKAAPAPQDEAPKPASSEMIAKAPVSKGEASKVFATPLARRIAEQNGVSISSVNGSGPHGRVVMRDVEAAQQGGGRSLATPRAAGERIFASPLARKLAKDKNIDIASLGGSGPNGRIIARDVEGAKAGTGIKPAAAQAPAAKAPAPAAPAGPTDDQIRALFKEGTYETVKHDGMRRIIAQRLVQAKSTIPHFYLSLDCDIGKLLGAREDINASAPKGEDGKPTYKLSVNDFVIKALAAALVHVPDANVTWTESAMLRHHGVDVGVAVSIPGGLITPVIRDAHSKPVSQISQEMKDFAARAKARKLKPEEYQGGTTAVSNLGMFGITTFSAVINPPQSTILAVGVGEDRAVVREGRIKAATMMTVTLSCDHRAVDGALGAQLLKAFKDIIENPVMMVA